MNIELQAAIEQVLTNREPVHNSALMMRDETEGKAVADPVAVEIVLLRVLADIENLTNKFRKAGY